MYNATKGVHHTVKTDTVCHSKGERNPFPCIMVSSFMRLVDKKKEIGIAQEQRICYPADVSWK